MSVFRSKLWKAEVPRGCPWSILLLRLPNQLQRSPNIPIYHVVSALHIIHKNPLESIKTVGSLLVGLSCQWWPFPRPDSITSGLGKLRGIFPPATGILLVIPCSRSFFSGTRGAGEASWVWRYYNKESPGPVARFNSEQGHFFSLHNTISINSKICQGKNMGAICSGWTISDIVGAHFYPLPTA